ncbi:hypothetical protein GCM10022630_28020 [Thermobifida alba]
MASPVPGAARRHRTAGLVPVSAFHRARVRCGSGPPRAARMRHCPFRDAIASWLLPTERAVPRNRPAGLRAARARPEPRFLPPPVHIPGLRLGTCPAIRRVELTDDRVPLVPGVFLHPGATARALRRYWEFLLNPPGPHLRYPTPAECPCPECRSDDVCCARDVLAEVLSRLPPRPRCGPGRVVRALEAEFLRAHPAPPGCRLGARLRPRRAPRRRRAVRRSAATPCGR